VWLCVAALLLCGLGVVAAESGVVINEVLTKSDAPLEDAIELYNPGSVEVNIGGWYLTDDQNTPKKYRIPSNTIIAAGGYAVFYHTQFAASFSLSGQGEDVYLFAADSIGTLTGYSHGFSFGPADTNVSFGRIVTSDGNEYFPPQVTRTLGAANSGPAIGPVVVHEIMYDPATGGDEFLELRNVSGSPVQLYDPQSPLNTWKISGIGYTLPPNLQLGPNELLVVVPIDPEVFRLKYKVPDGVQIAGPYTGSLANSGEKLELLKPGQPEKDPNTGQYVVPYILVDLVRYNDAAPWPVEAKGLGASLERINAGGFGSEPSNWRASTGAGGSPGRMPSFDHDGDGIADDVDTDDDNDGFSDIEELAAGTNPLDPLSHPGGTADCDKDGLTDDVDTDDDNDRVSDKNEIAAGTNPYDAKSFPITPLQLVKFAGKIAFPANGHDACNVTGTLPSLPFGFNPAGVTMLVSIGGMEFPFALDAKGRAKNEHGTLQLTLRPVVQKVFQGGNIAFRAVFVKGTFDAWKYHNITADAPSDIPIDMPVNVSFGGKVYGGSIATIYKHKLGKGGTLAMPKKK
jgi:hypothetical protein